MFSSVLLGGCQAEKNQALHSSVNAYAMAIKHGDIQRAASFVDAEGRPNFLKKSSELEGITVSQMELQNIAVSKDSQSAVSTFLVELYSMYGTEISVLRRDFNWVYDNELKGWKLLAPSPLSLQK